MPVCCRAASRRHGAVTSSAQTGAVAAQPSWPAAGVPALVATAAGVAPAASLAVATASGGYWPSRPGPGHWMPSCVFA